MSQATAKTKSAIDAFIRSLSYDPRQLLAVQPDGATQSLPPTKERSLGSGSVIIATKRQHRLSKNLSDVAILRPTAGVIYPGALVLADVNLMEGQPTPISLGRAPIAISTDLPGVPESRRVISEVAHSTVQDAAAQLLEAWHQTRGDYQIAARSFLTTQSVFSSMQASLDLGFNAKWADGAARAQLNGSTSSETKVLLANYRQIFYTVTMDTPALPSNVFDDSVSEADLRNVISASHPPAYVRSVDYGRILMIRMETTSSKSTMELQTSFKQIAKDLEVEGHVNAELQAIARQSKFTVVAIGGGVEQAAQFDGTAEDLQRLGAYIRENASFRRDNPGAPISYNVAFLKDNVMATMGFTTDYTETESVLYPNGFVRLKHSGGYVAKFYVNWEEGDANGNFKARSWESGQQTAGYSHQVNLPGDARNVTLRAEAATGLVWNPWGEIFSVAIAGPDNKTYRATGTTLHRSWDNQA
jgi:thiol-activated cytolysin